MFNLFKRKAEPAPETRSVQDGFTGQVMALRENWIAGQTGLADLTATVQAAVGLWEGALAASDVQGTDLLTRAVMAQAARSLALRGESLWYISDNGLQPVSDYDFSTANGKIKAYRLTIPDAGGGRSVTALASEVLHFKIGVDSSAPWTGTSPLRRAKLTAEMLHVLETALSETYANAPLGSSVVPFPESTGTDLETLARGFKGRRGRVLLRESVNVAAQGSVAPNGDWRPQGLTPNLEASMATQNWKAARDSVLTAFGILPGGFDAATTGPMVREVQRHLAGWTLQPMAMLMAEEASEKLGGKVEIDVMRPVQAYDVSGRARAMATLVQGLAQAKEAGIDPDAALRLVNWGNDDGAF
ncbi:phage portal protein BeeE [Paracoccus pantotrophus]|uniref:Phage portal protein n=1 Tax=Paracoccus pantotrophus TaxID=82367 RepID=A0AAE6NYT2_PARPN|nr:phage portal protein [Paracoccus pantotrophus]QFG37552.1 phage portal protein [Paracoccus pantotrophus]RKS51994.1 phage portal protein BeeE [Paracoccus pantotrophus]